MQAALDRQNTKETRGSAMIVEMRRSELSPERKESVARFDALIAYLRKVKMWTTDARLAVELGTSGSRIARQKERGVSPEFQTLLHTKLGLGLDYWTSPTRLDPGMCLRFLAPSGESTKGSLALSREKTLDLAKSRHEPDEVLAAISKIDGAGHEGDAWWWVEEYLKISDAHRAEAPKRASNERRSK